MPEGMTVNPEEQLRGPESIPETPEVYKKLVKHCADLLKAFKDSTYRKKKLEKIAESRRVYEQEREDDGFPFENATNIELPLTAITVDNIEPRFVAALVGKDPIVNFEMDGMEEKDEQTEVLQDFFNKELRRTVQMETQARDMVHLLLMEGTVFPLPRYDITKKTVRDFVFGQGGQLVMVPATGPNGEPGSMPKIEDREVKVHEGGKLELVPFTDMFFPDNAGTIEEWDECDKARRVNYEYGELMNASPDAGFLTQFIGPWLFDQKSGLTTSEKTPTQEGMGLVTTGKETIACHEFYVSYPIYQDQTKEWKEQTDFRNEKILVTITEQSQTVIRLKLQREILFNNESVIKRIRIFPEQGRTCGSSIYEKMASIQKGASDLFNQMLNVAWLVMMPWYFYDNRSGLSGDTDLYPGKGVQVENVQGILFPQFKGNPAQYEVFLNNFIAMWERIGNISDWNIGRQNEVGGKRTATEVMGVLQEGNIVHNYRAQTVREEFVIVLRTLYDLYYQWMPFDKKFLYQGKQVPINRQLMKRNVRFVLMGSTEAANRMIERKEAEDFLMLTANDPLFNPMKSREDLVKAWGKQNVAEYLNPQAKMLIDALLANPEIPQVVGQYLQTKATIAADAGMQPGNEGQPIPGGAPNQPMMQGMAA